MFIRLATDRAGKIAYFSSPAAAAEAHSGPNVVKLNELIF